jgi:LysW-gamma-L-lysine carboxypeptidase
VHQYAPDACIIGEPSGADGVTLGYKGRLLCEATVNTSNAHSAGEEVSASDAVLQWWSHVTEEVSQLNAGVERVFDQIQTSVLAMNSASDGLTQRASIRAGFRLPLTMTANELQRILTKHASGIVQLSFSGAESAYATDRNDPVVRALTSSIRSLGSRPHPKLKTGTADLNVVAPIWNCPIAAYGPGDSALDHRPDEHLVLDEYLQSIQVLKGAIQTLAEELLAQREEQVCNAQVSTV